MSCSKHPNYKGYRKPKRDCPECIEIWRQLQRELWKKGKKYTSITTPGFKCDLSHLFAEISCVMLYGKLPYYFWRKGNSPNEVRKQYQTVLIYIRKLEHHSSLLSAMEIILNAIYIRPFKRKVASILNPKPKTEVAVQPIPKISKEPDADFSGDTGINKKEALQKLFGETNEKKE